MNKNDVLSIFHPVISEWFQKNIGVPSLPQIEGWPAIQRGENVLIVAPTGAGKTLTAFLECINSLFMQGIRGALEDGVQVLYVSPLKALNNDIYRNLEMPLEGIREICSEKGICCPEICKAVRTGDTPASERRSMQKRPPHILITTPESLYLLLTSSGSRHMLSGVRYVIIDEIHTLIDNKRGVHMALSMERIAHIVGRPICRIGLSATVRPVEEAAKYLGGFEKAGDTWKPRPVTIIQPPMGKEVDLKISMPVSDFRAIEDKTIWPSIYRQVLDLVICHTSTLVFVNNRAVAEKVAANLNKLAGRDIAKAHHGCISKESRLEVEKQLKKGELPCLVATSSLELGIDVGAIDLVVQIASPKSAARGLQRLGRAGHKLNAVSRGRIIPRTRGDLLESAIVSKEMMNRNIEDTMVPKNCLDILAQHIVSLAWDREWHVDEIMEIFRSAYSYQTLKTDELERVLSMLAGEYEHREEAPRSPRIIWDRVNKVIRGNSYSRMLAIGSGGTIPDRGYYGVYLEDGKTRLGELDEVFVFEARIGERFMLGTSAWRIEEIRRDRVIVSPTGAVGAKTPFWTGDGLGRPYQLGLSYGKFLAELSKKAGTDGFLPWIMSCVPVDETGAYNIENYIIEQKEALGCLPTDKRIVVEYFSDEVGEKRIVIHSPFGGRVNGGLAIILESELSKALHSQVQSSYNDDGVLIGIMGCDGYPQNILSVLVPENIEDILIDRLPETPLFSMTFRYNAARALMMGMRRQSKRTQLWAQRLRAMEAMQIAEKYRDHPLIVETFRECMETILDVPDLIDVANRIKSGDIQVVERVTTHPSPFTSELLFKFMGVMMYEGQMPDPKNLKGRIISKRDALNLNYNAISHRGLFNREAVLNVMEQNNPISKHKNINSSDELHGMLMTYGDMPISGEKGYMLENMCGGNFRDWVEKLKCQKRAEEIDIDNDGKYELLIAAEESELYSGAFGEAACDGGEVPWTRDEALLKIIRRFARYNSPFGLADVKDRYGLDSGTAEKALRRLEEDGILIKDDYLGDGKDEWCHTVIFDRMRNATMRQTRNSVEAVELYAFAGFLPCWQGVGREGVSAEEELYDAVKKLQGLYLPPEWWEGFIFPTRVSQYRKKHLDRLCSTGRITWRIKLIENSPKLAWYTTESLCEKDADSIPDCLEASEKTVYEILQRKGASFLHVLSAASHMESNELISTLERMVMKGYVINDSFEPIRYFLSAQPKSPKMKAMIRASAFRMDMGRWSLCPQIEEEKLEEYLETLFNRYGLVTREIIQCEKTGCSWGEAYEILKQWEYVGKVNRGYFVKGLSGIQYMSLSASAALYNNQDEVFVIDACDPSMVYGRIASSPLQSWSAVPGTAVVLKSGKPVLIVECYGKRFIPAAEDRGDVLKGIDSFVEAFNKGAIWGDMKKIKIRQWKDTMPVKCEFADELCAAGFEREMQDMVLWK